MPEETPRELTFSQRMGLSPVRRALQINSMDEPLRNGLWNVVLEFLCDPLCETIWFREYRNPNLIGWIWAGYFDNTMDRLPENTRDIVKYFREYFFSCEWNNVYDLIQFLARRLQAPYADRCNKVLERHHSGYRFTGKYVLPITSEEEITAVEAATAFSDQFKPVSDHLKNALEKFSDRTSPDYRNSIKESISAVEAMCQILTGETGAVLGQAVKKLEDSGVKIHPAFAGALQKMYGYTSDAEGIRHALLDEPTLDSADALFMLVSCSAFVNYLKSKSSTTQ
jgi:hypothetical protein